MRSIVLTFFMFFSVLSVAWAGEPVPGKKYVQTRLVAEVPAIEPGQPFWVAFEQAIEPDWHTYWKNPGDSGFATQLTWTLPEGFKADPMLWPTPERIPFGELLNFGYSKGVIFLTKITPPQNLPAQDITLTVKGEWLVCHDICIPEDSTLSITLPVANESTPIEPDSEGYFAAARLKLPQPMLWTGSYTESNGDFILTFEAADKTQDILRGKKHALFPEEWGLYKNLPEVKIGENGKGQVMIAVPRGDRSLGEVDQGTFVLSYKSADGQDKSYQFNAQKLSLAAPAGTSEPVKNENQVTFLAALGLALLGGLVLNLMPCVFPVLSLKALSLVKHTDQTRRFVITSGFLYTVGVVATFIAIAGIMIALKSAGTTIGWGFQLQNPFVVTGLAILLFVIGLNLSGFFEWRGFSVGTSLAQGESLSSSFFTGVLATLVATPCTAPFMGAAMGYALVQPTIMALSVFAVLGFGLALPYLMLCLVPALQLVLPRPGAWMMTFKQFLAFPMYASAIWLVWVLAQQSGAQGVALTLILALSITFAMWAWARGIVMRALGFVLLMSALWALKGLAVQPSMQTSLKEIAYTESALQNALATNQGVFVNMTAAWCITCKINEGTALQSEDVQKLFSDQKITYIVGDWTNRNPEITKFLNAHGRNGVPLYLYYAPRQQAGGERPPAVVLPQLLTPKIIKNTIKESVE